ncbi:GntR family transcriptional regulator [Geminicoccaceae bacterium 1502E]|nr:GntR family transcriptional regulator [Geminicoccaceae bacterium 1502E]
MGTRSGALYETIADLLRRSIRDGTLRRGQPLRAGSLAEQLGVSRTPVRRALDVLRREGLVDEPAGGPPRVGGGAAGHAVSAQGVRLPAGDLRRRPRWQEVYAAVETELGSRLAFGAYRLGEPALAAAMGVSRTIVREALARLQQVGLLDKDPRGHWRTLPLDPPRARDLYEIRRLLEPAALVAAGPRLPKRFVAGLRRRHLAARSACPDVPGAMLDALERDLHVTCLGYAPNRDLLRLLRGTQSLMIINHHLFDRYLALPPMEDFIGEHLAVIGRLEAGDWAGAAQGLHGHLRRSEAEYMERLERLRGLEPPAPPGWLVPQPSAPLSVTLRRREPASGSRG